MNKKTPPPYNTFPSSAKNGILFLLSGWAMHFLFLYALFGKELESQIWLQQSIIALLVCFFTIRVRNWARVLGIVANLLIILVYLFAIAYLYSIHLFKFSFFASAIVILFSISTFFLFKRSTSDFFKLHSPRLGENRSDNK